MDIVELIGKRAPITGEQIAEELGVSRPTLRSDLSLLVMLGYIDAKPKVGYFPGKADAKAERPAPSHLADVLVKDVQAMPVIVRETATVNDAVVTLFMENVGNLIVADADGRLLGVVSRKDLLKVTLGNPSAAAMPISLVMTRTPNVVTVVPEDSVLEAARKMIVHQVDSLPVIAPASVATPATGRTGDRGASELPEVVGRISKTTITKLLLDYATGG
ncbi:helix-turn-helix transcriptional regulator [Paenibacillus cymbidii]|uniref:helix-turn-helix transcriptional regulator n=1 Tax=Paenibacillus cymbidii TaxID=1639034 RepID=UPI0010807CE7|nr:helix-turn-helix transcriptional regulator [Paenibacillus cymbidii]